MIKNLTTTPIIIRDADQEEWSDATCFTAQTIDMVLPEENDKDLFIVDRVVFEANPERQDLLFLPEERDEKGRYGYLIGCTPRLRRVFISETSKYKDGFQDKIFTKEIHICILDTRPVAAYGTVQSLVNAGLCPKENWWGFTEKRNTLTVYECDSDATALHRIQESGKPRYWMEDGQQFLLGY